MFLSFLFSTINWTTPKKGKKGRRRRTDQNGLAWAVFLFLELRTVFLHSRCWVSIELKYWFKQENNIKKRLLPYLLKKKKAHNSCHKGKRPALVAAGSEARQDWVQLVLCSAWRFTGGLTTWWVGAAQSPDVGAIRKSPAVKLSLELKALKPKPPWCLPKS